MPRVTFARPRARPGGSSKVRTPTAKPNTVLCPPQPQPTEARPSRARPQCARGLRPSRSPCTRWPWRPC
eukprot:84982-Prymnesium_polylepis.1